MQIIRNFRRFLLLGLFVYTFQHIYFNCPLNSKIDYSSLSTNANRLSSKPDYICVSSHVIYEKITPIVDTVKTPILNYYAVSPIKPYVDSASDCLSNFYSTYFQSHVNKSFKVFSGFQNDFTNFKNLHEDEFKELFENSSKTLENHIYQLINFVDYNFKTYILPTTLKSISFLNENISIFLTKLKIFIYLNYNIHIKPIILRNYQKFLATSVGSKWIEFQRSLFFTKFVDFLKLVNNSIKRISDYLVEKYFQFIEAKNSFKYSDHYKDIENKKTFLKNEFNKILNANFKIEDFDIFKKLKTNDEKVDEKVIETTKSDSFSTPVPVPTSEKYDSLLRSIILSANKDFESQVDNISEKFILSLNKNLEADLKNLGIEATSGYEKIHKILHQINEFRNPDDLLYVSRQDYRDILNEKSFEFEKIAEKINEKLRNLQKVFIDDVLKARINVLETLEEFSDSTLNAYSTEIVSNGDDWEEWKKFKELKKDLVHFRDDLITKNPKTVSVDNEINKIKNSVNVLINEGGSYLAILRAKGNIEFQSREKEEREAKKEKEEVIENPEEVDYDDDEEDITETSTIIVTQTVVIDDKIETKSLSDDKIETKNLTNDHKEQKKIESIISKAEDVIVDVVEDTEEIIVVDEVIEVAKAIEQSLEEPIAQIVDAAAEYVGGAVEQVIVA